MIVALVYGALAVMAVTVCALIKGLHVIKQHERAVVFRLGRVLGVKEPGFCWVSPVDRVVRVSLQSVAIQVPKQPAMHPGSGKRE